MTAGKIKVAMISLVFICHAFPLHADSLTFDFGEYDHVNCDEPWFVSSVEMILKPYGVCRSSHTYSGWWLVGACLIFNLRDLPDFRTAEIAITTFGAPGNTIIYLMNRTFPHVVAYNGHNAVKELIVLEAGEHDMVELRIYAEYVYLHEVTLRFGPVSAEAPSWGMLKALYR